jgi:hypothetical protein
MQVCIPVCHAYNWKNRWKPSEGDYLKVYRFHSESHHLIEKKIAYMAAVLHLNNALLAKNIMLSVVMINAFNKLLL